MNGAQLHLALNHLPVIGTLIALLVLAAGMALRNETVRRTALVLLVGAGLAAGGAFLTGEPAEEVIEGTAGVSKDAIHEHEEAAELALTASGILAVLALGVLVAGRRRSLPGTAHGAVLVGALAVTVIMGRAAHLGGLIRHPELGAATAAQGGGEKGGDRD